jgi:hypothetical protein
VADFTRRPLLSLTVADIGTDERTMENNLHRWFEMAASWDAIILIDEADVFLEKRTVADLQRNSLVSGKCLTILTVQIQSTNYHSLPTLYGILYRDVVSSKTNLSLAHLYIAVLFPVVIHLLTYGHLADH